MKYLLELMKRDSFFRKRIYKRLEIISQELPKKRDTISIWHSSGDYEVKIYKIHRVANLPKNSKGKTEKLIEDYIVSGLLKWESKRGSDFLDFGTLRN